MTVATTLNYGKKKRKKRWWGGISQVGKVDVGKGKKREPGGRIREFKKYKKNRKTRIGPV